MDVLTLGTITRDVFIQSPLFKVLKDKNYLENLGFKTGEVECFALGSKIQINRPVFSGGGGAHNAAITFARQGLKTGIAGLVGDDVAGKEILKLLRSEKIRPFVKKSEKIGTGYSIILMAEGGERTILTYRGASNSFQKKDIPISSIHPKWIYVSPGEISFSTLFPILSVFKKRNTKIAINPSRFYLDMKKSDLFKIFKLSNVVIMNREEASYFTDMKYTDERGIFRRFDELIDGIAVVTDGRRGAIVSDGSYMYRAGIFEEKAMVDRTGAGDAFGSGFIAGLIEKNDVHFALRLAAANATSVVERIGATEGILTKKDFLKKRWGFLNLDVENV